MILDALGNAGRYAALGERFGRAFRFLEGAGTGSLEPGRHAIDGERVYAIVSDGPGRRREEGRLETHARYADVQYVVSGVDEMGWKPAPACVRPCGPYDPGKDVAFFEDAPDAWVAVRAGSFALFFPEDAHLPLVSGGNIRKVVVKVSLEPG
jgi:YhcH/YjgK/YiaL family protein